MFHRFRYVTTVVKCGAIASQLSFFPVVPCGEVSWVMKKQLDIWCWWDFWYWSLNFNPWRRVVDVSKMLRTKTTSTCYEPSTKGTPQKSSVEVWDLRGYWPHPNCALAASLRTEVIKEYFCFDTKRLYSDGCASWRYQLCWCLGQLNHVCISNRFSALIDERQHCRWLI
jgi:hypothetical protein